jgi:3-oxoacyl-[acyl-carrier-protein] synthase-1
MESLLHQAVDEAWSAVGPSLGHSRVGMIGGLPSPRAGVSAGLAARLAAALGERHPRMRDVRWMANGHASGLMAIGAAARALKQDEADFMLAAAVDSQIDADLLEWLDQRERLHIATNAWGYLPGEGAACCVLCRADTASRHALDVLGRVVAVASARETHCIYTESICLGQGLTSAVRHATSFLPAGTRIDDTLCDQNGDAYRADEFGFMLARTGNAFVDSTRFSAPADCWGDVGAASGALFVVLAATAGRKGYAAGVHTLMLASSETGERGALVFAAVAGASGDRPWR